MDNEFAPDLITVVDDQNEEHNFEIIDTIENEKGVFYALAPIYDDPESAVMDSGDYVIMELIEEDGVENLFEIDDDELFYELADIFDKRFEGFFYEED